jgi:hypothetical protein
MSFKSQPYASKKEDQRVYELLPDETVVIREISPLDLQYFHALDSTLNEWESDDVVKTPSFK